MQIGVHVLDSASPATLVRKTLRSNLSDLAAMGARPLYYLLGLALGDVLSQTQADELVVCLRSENVKYGISLIGGDTTRSNSASLASITAIGNIPAGQNALRRSGAQEGDDLWVTGALGDAALGLAILSGRMSSAIGLLPSEKFVIERYLQPSPRIEAGLALRSQASGAIDISDGLTADCAHLAKASGLSARINVDALPRSAAMQNLLSANPNPELEWALLNGGDDYELLFSAAANRRPEIDMISHELNLPMTRIGTIEVGEGISLYSSAGGQMENLPLHGFTHF